MLRDEPGSQLRVSITVSHHSDWWLPLLHSKELPKRQTSELNTTSTLATTFSSLQIHLLPSRTSATIFPAFQLPHQVTSSGVGEMIYKCTLCDGVKYCMMRSTDTAVGWRWDPSPCWRRTGLLHLLREWLQGWGDERGCQMKGSDRHLINTNLTRLRPSEGKKRQRSGIVD